MTTEEKLKNALEAIELAYDVMNYSRGDSWERECTEKSFNEFLNIRSKLIPIVQKENEFEYNNFYDTVRHCCPICNKMFSAKGLTDHYIAKHNSSLIKIKREKLVKQIHFNNYEILKEII